MTRQNMDHTPDLERDAYMDTALDIPNQKGCLREMERIFSEASRKNKGHLLKIYLDDFKSFNDTFGYHYGDKLLLEIARFLDTIAPGQVYRYGGVEFMLLLEKTPYYQVKAMAQAIIDRFVGTWRIEGLDCMCSASVGFVAYPDMASSVSDALTMLDHAIQAATQRGQNQIAVFDSAIRDKVIRRKSIANHLRDALQNDSIEIRYRPLYSVKSGKFTAAETYLRLHTPDNGVVYSAEFLRIAEDAGVICSINQYVIRKVCAYIRELIDSSIQFEAIAVPVSPIQFLQENFVEDVSAILEEYDIPAEKLTFEVSESALLNNSSAIIINMQELSGLGIKLVLNDFGTGFSGITNLLTIPVDILRFERSFIWQLEINPPSVHIIEGLIRIAQNLGLSIIAEGVETERQDQLLHQCQCDYLQGLYYAPTVTPVELAALLDQAPPTKGKNR